MAARERYRPSRRGTPTDFRSRHTTRISTDPSFVFKDLERQVATLSVDPVGDTSECARLRHVNAVASYSWIDAPVPTILVPGSPWIWTDEHAQVKQVPRDQRVRNVHPDASEERNYSPLLPLFAAIDVLHDNFAYTDLDLVADLNGLRKLLRYIDNVYEDSDHFRIDVELVGKTCFFTWQESATIVFFTGYGHEYMKAATRAPTGCENMLHHHRIVNYEFGSLNILLTFTPDACIEPKTNDDDLASFSSLSIGGTPAETTAEPKKQVSPTSFNIQLGPSRALVPQSDLIEVKTKSKHGEPNWGDLYPRLYLSQTAWLYIARHDRGVFQPAEKISLTGEEMKPYAEMVEESLDKLKNLLEAILRAVREQGEGVPLSLVRQGGTLSLWRRKVGGEKPLGEEITTKFKFKGKAVDRT